MFLNEIKESVSELEIMMMESELEYEQILNGILMEGSVLNESGDEKKPGILRRMWDAVVKMIKSVVGWVAKKWKSIFGPSKKDLKSEIEDLKKNEVDLKSSVKNMKKNHSDDMGIRDAEMAIQTGISNVYKDTVLQASGILKDLENKVKSLNIELDDVKEKLDQSLDIKWAKQYMLYYLSIKHGNIIKVVNPKYRDEFNRNVGIINYSKIEAIAEHSKVLNRIVGSKDFMINVDIATFTSGSSHTMDYLSLISDSMLSITHSMKEIANATPESEDEIKANKALAVANTGLIKILGVAYTKLELSSDLKKINNILNGFNNLSKKFNKKVY